MIELIIGIGFLALSFSIGSRREKAHYRDLAAREALVRGIPVVTGKHFVDTGRSIARVELVSGAVAIAQDSFKNFVGSLVNLFGGNIKPLESLLDRGRREAMLRMIESAGKPDIILNVRMETSTIGSSKGEEASGNAEMMAYGTAIYYAR